MAVFSGMFPIVPGKEGAARAWLAEIAGPRKQAFDAMQRRSEITRETVTVQATPGGAFLLIWFEGNVEKGFEVVMTEQDPFTAWHRERLLDVTGFDPSATEEGSPPETIIDWRA